MSQPPYGPPGQYPPPYGQGPHGQNPLHGPGPRYGQPPYGYGQPGYGQAPPPPPKKKTGLLLWLIVGGAVLLSGLGVLLVVLLGGNDTTATPTAAPHSTAAASSAPTPSASAPAHGELPGGAQVADRNTGGRAKFAGSDQVALTWVQAMADGHYQSAYDLSCADVQQSATDAAAGGDPARELGTYFFEQTLSGQGFTDGSFDSIIYNRDTDSDIASFTLQLENGQEFVLLVYVQGDGTVCDFI
jgi:hypothetical protein